MPVAEPGGTLHKFWARGTALGGEAVISWLVGYIASRVVPVPSVGPGAGQDVLILYYLLGYGFIGALGGVAYYWLWRPVRQIREDKSKLYELLNTTDKSLRRRAMGEDHKHKPKDYDELETIVLGRAICSKVIECFEDIKALGDRAFVAIAILIPVVTFGAFYVPIFAVAFFVIVLIIVAILGTAGLFRLIYRGQDWYGVGEWKRQISILYDKSRLPDAEDQVIEQFIDWGKKHPSKYPVKGGFSK